MTHCYIDVLIAAIVQALLVHACAEAWRAFLIFLAPELPLPLCFAISIVLSVILIEGAAELWWAVIHANRQP
jgi:hypothetical protein